MENILIYFAIIGAVMVSIIVVAAVIYYTGQAKRTSESKKSLPKGADSSDFGKALQDKYRAERDSGDFKRADFL